MSIRRRRRLRVSPVRRRVEAVLAVTAIGGMLLATSAGAAGAEREAEGSTVTAIQEDGDGASNAARPPLWVGQGAAAGLSLAFNTDPALLPLDEFINFNLPYGESKWSSAGDARAVASALNPGTAFTQGPTLLCNEFADGCAPGFPPEYPLIAEADRSNPDASTQAGEAQAHAGQDYVETRAGASTLVNQGLGPLAAVVSIGQVETVTSLTFSEDGSTATSRAEARLSEVALLDGLIEIDGIEVVSISVTNGQDVVDQTTDTVVSGVTVAGNPATISEDGIVIAGQGGGGQEFADAQQQLRDGLQEYGADLRLLGTNSDTDEESASGSARGLFLSFDVPLEGPALPGAPDPQLPDPNTVYRNYVGSVTLGLADSTAFVSTSGFDLGGLGDLGDLGDVGNAAPPAATDQSTSSGSSLGGFTGPSAGSNTGTSGSPSFDSTAPSSSDGASDGSGDVAAPIAAGPGTPDDDAGDAATPMASGLLLSGSAAEQLKNVYLAITIASLLALGASRLLRVLGRPGV